MEYADRDIGISRACIRGGYSRVHKSWDVLISTTGHLHIHIEYKLYDLNFLVASDLISSKSRISRFHVLFSPGLFSTREMNHKTEAIPQTPSDKMYSPIPTRMLPMTRPLFISGRPSFFPFLRPCRKYVDFALFVHVESQM